METFTAWAHENSTNLNDQIIPSTQRDFPTTPNFSLAV